MKPVVAVVADDALSRMVELLHDVEQQIALLTAGEVDTVTNSDGRTLLLRQAQETLRHSEGRRQTAILSALPANIALLDAHGVIVTVNAAWRRFAGKNALLGRNCTAGVNYLDQCDPVRTNASISASEICAGIRSVLAGKLPRFSMEYSCESSAGRQWYLFTVAPLLDDLLHGVVVMHMDVTSERDAKDRVMESESRFRQMAETIHDVFFLRSVDAATMHYVSPAYERIWGRTCESLYADPLSWSHAMHPDDLHKTLNRFRSDQPTGFEGEFRVIRPGGSIRWVHVRGFPVVNAAGEHYRTAGVATDITDRKEAEARIKRHTRVYAMLSGINSLIVRVRSRDELFAGACRIAVEAGGFSTAWIGTIDSGRNEGKAVAWFGRDESYVRSITITSREGAPESNRPASRAMRLMQPVIHNDFLKDPSDARLRDEFLSRGHLSVACFPLTAAGVPAAVLTLMASEENVFDAAETELLLQLAADISFALDHLAKADQLQYIAYYDLLTGLANRRLFLERATQYVRVANGKGHKLAMYIVDLERFKNINDTFGQPAGDELLRQLAQWLIVNAGDVNLLARVGADLFAILVPEVKDEEEVARQLENSLQLFMEHPFRLKGSEFHFSAKVGIALFPDDGDNAEILFRNAESALKKAKASGDRYLFYAEKMTETVTARLTMEYQLRHALDNEQFVLHYQPKIHSVSGELTGVEALIRWNDPAKGLIPPGKFIPILEETGLICDVGRWALRKALNDYQRWLAQGLTTVRIAVNVSPVQLRQRNFTADIEDAISISADAAAALELEITENVIMTEIEQSIACLHRIQLLGVRIAIDDFGTGFSSLSYLSRLPVDALKIDRSFVTEMTSGPQGRSLVAAIINLAHSLELNVVAEGVETSQQADLLRTLNCDEMQGFLFSKPIPSELFEARFLQPHRLLRD